MYNIIINDKNQLLMYEFKFKKKNHQITSVHFNIINLIKRHFIDIPSKLF